MRGLLCGEHGTILAGRRRVFGARQTRDLRYGSSRWIGQVNDFRSSNRSDRNAAIADVIVLWNVLEHFWPYRDTVPVDWSAVLDRALTDALHDHSMSEHAAPLPRCVRGRCARRTRTVGALGAASSRGALAMGGACGQRRARCRLVLASPGARNTIGT
jgi:hypothetical protein